MQENIDTAIIDNHKHFWEVQLVGGILSNTADGIDHGIFSGIIRNTWKGLIHVSALYTFDTGMYRPFVSEMASGVISPQHLSYINRSISNLIRVRCLFSNFNLDPLKLGNNIFLYRIYV